MNLEQWFSQCVPGVSFSSIETVLKLSAEGATVPFLARYRKEATGGLDEVQIQNALDAKESFDTITSRQKYIVDEIERQGKLTDELKSKILSTFQSTLLEDLYLPYKVKKKSKATLAKEAGLTELAEWIWDIGHGTREPEPGQTLEIWAFTFKNEEKGFVDADKCIAGATDILIERLSENAELRAEVREKLFKQGALVVGKAEKAKPNSKYEMYFTFEEKIENLQKKENSHRYLAIRRGWMEEELTLSLGGGAQHPEFETELVQLFEKEACTKRDSEVAPALLKAAKLALKAHVLPSIENEAHKAMKEVADSEAIQVFAENLKKLLLASPFGPKAVLGVDPGVRTGCKLAVVNDSGKFVADTVIFLQTEDQKSKAKELLKTIVETGGIRAIAVGNGTAGRETEAFIRQALKEANLTVPVVMVSESGASVYSASEVAREEFPELDLTVRGAISIARRLQDPLAELVKVDPKSIGVGQYQHDVSPNSLKKSLELVVDSCVNSVGVNLNTASYHLLKRVSGIGEALAKSIVEVRSQKGLFKSRQELPDVPRFSTKTFEQAPGFPRVPENEKPLDNTGVHPERYSALEDIAKRMGKSLQELASRDAVAEIRNSKEFSSELKEKLGELTFKDVLAELEKPGRDPRDSFVAFSYRDDIFELKDVKPEMICPGIVTNVTNFGAFVDIGVHQDGLVHISQISDRFVKDPREAVSPGDHVTVKVLEVNLEKSQMAFTMKGLSGTKSEKPAAKTKAERSERGERRPRKPEAPKLKPSGPPRPVKPRDPSAPTASAAVTARRPELKPSGAKSPVRPQFANNPFASALAGMKNGLKK